MSRWTGPVVLTLALAAALATSCAPRRESASPAPDSSEQVANGTLASRTRAAVPSSHASLVASVDASGSQVVVRLNQHQPEDVIGDRAGDILASLMAALPDVSTVTIVDSTGLLIRGGTRGTTPTTVTTATSGPAITPVTTATP